MCASKEAYKSGKIFAEKFFGKNAKMNHTPNDNINQKLALLPEGIAESNLLSWEEIVSFYKGFVENPMDDILPGNFYDKVFYKLFNLVKDFSETEQAKLFRAGQSVYDLMISTADKRGLNYGEYFVRVAFAKEIILIQYETAGPISDDENPNIHEGYSCNLNDDLIPVLHPLLNRLWDDTRGRKNA